MDRTGQELALNNLINALNLKSDELYALYTANREPLRPLANRFFVAKIEIDIEIDPNTYDLNGGKAHLETVYNENVGDYEKSRCVTYESGLQGRGITRFYPVKGHEWTETEWDDITTLGRMMYIVYSRAKLMNNIHRSKHLDIMTGLLNNAGIIAACTGLFRKGYASEDYAAIFMNIKNLKMINRSFGNREGDRVLVFFAKHIYSFTEQDQECAARLGGDNFYVLIKKERLDDFLKLVSDLHILMDKDGEEQDIKIECRMGIYQCEQGVGMDIIMQKTGFAFETARRTAQNIVFFRAEMQERVLQQRWVTAVFPEAMLRGEVVPFYQPKVHIGERKLIGAEALVRWIKNGKPVSPAEFIPYLENDSLITRVDQYMLEAVCRDLRGWIDMGIDPVRISVNYSRRDFLEKTLAEDTLAILDKYGIDGKYIEIEVTESSFYEDYHALASFTNKMHKRGVHVSMDDFGTGYSSLSMFKNLDFDVVKLDKAFIDTLGSGDSKDEIVVESIANMLTRLNTDIVAEGVETEDQVGRVKDLHCHIIQGYFFDRPLPYQDFQDRLKRRIYA
ncbi:MAG: GGDEF domain-containing protein [Lachnospiraceae bacterium]|nr:GGDEF domain-containing protein [Lachnospiraceae bacterium]